MADISKIKIGSTTYDIKDTTARNSITWKTPSRLWARTSSNTWKAGTSKTISTAPNYILLGALTQNQYGTVDLKMHIGTWSKPTSKTTNQGVSMATSFDTGSGSWIMKIFFSVTSSGTSWTLTNASGHRLDSNGNYGISNEINEFWGLM